MAIDPIKLKWRFQTGGSMGAHYALMYDGKYVGHFYVDAEQGVDVDAILKHIAEEEQ